MGQGDEAAAGGERRPAHVGRLQERIRLLREQCVQALGATKFNKVFVLLKEHLESRLNDSDVSFGGEDDEDEHSEAALRVKMLRILGKDQYVLTPRASPRFCASSDVLATRKCLDPRCIFTTSQAELLGPSGPAAVPDGDRRCLELNPN